MKKINILVKAWKKLFYLKISQIFKKRMIKTKNNLNQKMIIKEMKMK